MTSLPTIIRQAARRAVEIPGDFDVVGQAEEPAPRKLPAPLGVSALLGVEEPLEDWIVEGLLPAGGNILVAAYPKSFKTMFLLALAVALATGTPFLGRFRVPVRRRVGLVLMEDQAFRVRLRLERLCSGIGLALDDLDGWLHSWFRPPLRFNDQTVSELGDYAAELEFDFLGVDSWAYVGGGDHNDAAEVTPQLQAFGAIMVHRPGISLALVHHARKEKNPGQAADQRLTDVIRNSSAFGAWYDAGLVLTRKDETESHVGVRVELRDYETPAPFVFEVKDEYPASQQHDHRSGGWLRLLASSETPQSFARQAASERLVPAVREALAENPEGLSHGKFPEKVREKAKGRDTDIDAAFEVLEKAGEAEHIPPPGKGKAGCYRLLSRDPVPPCPDPVQDRDGENPVHPVPPYKGDRVRVRVTSSSAGPGQGSPALPAAVVRLGGAAWSARPASTRQERGCDPPAITRASPDCRVRRW